MEQLAWNVIIDRGMRASLRTLDPSDCRLQMFKVRLARMPISHRWKDGVFDRGDMRLGRSAPGLMRDLSKNEQPEAR
jgi:hypothetical protein